MAHAVFQMIGDRSHQCDATATYTDRGGARAFVLLDGIGSSDEVREWTRRTARELARAAAVRGSAVAGLRAMHTVIGAERRRLPRVLAYDEPAAVAVVAVVTPGGPLQVAWSGDSRAYLRRPDGELTRLTTDHNARQEALDAGLTPLPGDRNLVTSCLGGIERDPVVGAVKVPAAGRLLLASDGAYEPIEDSCGDLAAYLPGAPRLAARTVVTAAIALGAACADNATALVADLS